MAKNVVELLVKVIDQASKELEHINKTAQDLGRDVSQAGKTLTTGLTLPLVAAAGAAIKFSTDLNEGMANVATLIPGAADRVAELKENVQDLAVQTGKSTDDLAAGLYQVVSAFGDSAESALMLEQAAEAAVAGVASTADAIALTSAVTKAYGDTSAEAQRQVQDLAFQAVKLGETTFPELAASVGNVTPFMKELGASQEELFAVMATATGVTGGAAEVSTQLKGALQALLAPSADAAKLFEEMGLESGKALLQQEGLQGALETLVRAAEESGQPLQKFIGSIEGQTIALTLAGSQSEVYQEKLQAMMDAGGATAEAFAEQTEGINANGFAMKQLRQLVVTTAQDLGDAMAPALADVIALLKPMLENVASLAEEFAEADPAVQRTVVAVAALVAAIGPAITVLGGLITNAGALAGIFAGTGGVAATLSAVIPIVGAVAAAVAALYLAWQTNFGGIRDTAQRVWSNIQPVLAELMTNLGALAAAAVEAFDTIIRPLITALEPLFAGVFAAIGTILETFLGVVNSIVAAVAALLEGDFKSAFSNATDAVISIIQGLATAVLQILGSLPAAMLNLAGEIINGLVAGLQGGVELVVGAVSGVADSIIGNFKRILGIASRSKETYAMGLWVDEGLADGIKDNTELVKTAVKDLSKVVTETIEEDLGNWLTTLTSQIELGLARTDTIIGTLTHKQRELFAVLQEETLKGQRGSELYLETWMEYTQVTQVLEGLLDAREEINQKELEAVEASQAARVAMLQGIQEAKAQNQAWALETLTALQDADAAATEYRENGQAAMIQGLLDAREQNQAWALETLEALQTIAMAQEDYKTAARLAMVIGIQEARDQNAAWRLETLTAIQEAEEVTTAYHANAQAAMIQGIQDARAQNQAWALETLKALQDIAEAQEDYKTSARIAMIIGLQEARAQNQAWALETLTALQNADAAASTYQKNGQAAMIQGIKDAKEQNQAWALETLTALQDMDQVATEYRENGQQAMIDGLEEAKRQNQAWALETLTAIQNADQAAAQYRASGQAAMIAGIAAARAQNLAWALETLTALQDMDQEAEEYRENGQQAMIEGIQALRDQNAAWALETITAVQDGEQANREAAENTTTAWLAATEDIAAGLIALTEIDYTDGNDILSTYYNVSADIVELIPELERFAPVIRAVGSLLNAFLGDMANGAAQVRAELDQLSTDSLVAFEQLPGLIQGLVQRESRGGFLGFLGFTKQVLDAELLAYATAVADALSGGITQGFEDAAGLALDGASTADIYEALAAGTQQAIEQAIIEALKSQVILAALQPLLTQLTADLVNGVDPTATINAIGAALPGIVNALDSALGPLAEVLAGVFNLPDLESGTKSLEDATEATTGMGEAMDEMLDAMEEAMAAVDELTNSAMADMQAAFVSGSNVSFMLAEEVRALVDAIRDATLAGLDTSELEQSLSDTLDLMHEYEGRFQDASQFLSRSITGALNQGIETGDWEAAAHALDEAFKNYIIDTIIQMAVQAVLASTTVAQQLADITYLIQEAITTGDWSAVQSAVTGLAADLQDAFSNVSGIVQGALGEAFGGGSVPIDLDTSSISGLGDMEMTITATQPTLESALVDHAEQTRETFDTGLSAFADRMSALEDALRNQGSVITVQINVDEVSSEADIDLIGDRIARQLRDELRNQ